MVSTLNLARGDWLDVRRSGIGGSDAAAAVGLSPYKSALELWMEKTGRDAGLEKPDPTDTTHPTYWGSLLEPAVSVAYMQRTGCRVRRVNAVLQHPQHVFMLANLDREVVGNPDVQILECKTAGEFGARHWKDGVPEYVQLQVQHQLAVTGKRAADVAVLLCGQSLEIHRIERDDELIDRLITLEARFWRYVETDTPPPADGSESAGRALRCLYPDSGPSVDFSDNAALSETFAELVAVRERLALEEAHAEALRQTLLQAMREAGEATFKTGRITYKRCRDGLVVNTDRLCAEHAELAARYARVKPGTRRFRVYDER
nr:YqaJ viral recombinase family protein [Solimonas marina]